MIFLSAGLGGQTGKKNKTKAGLQTCSAFRFLLKLYWLCQKFSLHNTFYLFGRKKKSDGTTRMRGLLFGDYLLDLIMKEFGKNFNRNPFIKMFFLNLHSFCLHCIASDADWQHLIGRFCLIWWVSIMLAINAGCFN